ncbi:meiotic recombination protein REC8 homolog isoform X2 [Nomascus leucogenys]|uniref:meiotic recombination protein REC8 homolog isoform X2 n=1 Tax=Nomascus leucogenys TaxID=61853 RepID=UPI00122D9758|nr:meiotic recombination protein REC8 homolog isoform X2 [Nomascus leucogenys]
MFYYPNVLQRHTGCFATIWLAATRGSRLVKREYLRVNVVKTCEEILNYVLVRVQPPQPGLPRPRFSLYLSAQLQIGVIRVYSQQCQYLVEDIQHILERLHRAQLQIRIDMVTELPSLLLPNQLAMMETLEDAPDPFFGMMSVDPRLPSPFDIPQIRHLLEAAAPERVEEIPPEVPTEPRKPERIPVTVLPPEAITLLEAEPIRMLPIEGERELPEVSRRELDLLIAEEEEAVLLEIPRLPPPAPAEVEGIEEALGPEELRLIGWEPGALLMGECPTCPRGFSGSTWILLQTRALYPNLLKGGPCSFLPWHSARGKGLWDRATTLGVVAEVTPPEELRLPAPPSPERPPVPPPPRRRRRRQLLFWDKETQISREKFREQLQTRAHCRECPMVQPPERTITGPAELFRTPTLSGWLPPELLGLWTHCAQPPPKALRRELAEEERRKIEVPSEIEVPREALEPSGPLMVSPEISLEAAEEEKTRISLIPPEERWAWAEVEQPELPALPVVPELPEVPMEMPLVLPPELELLSLEAVHRAVARELQANREPDFSSLVSPLSPRRMAARVFYLLLGECMHVCVRGGGGGRDTQTRGPYRDSPDLPSPPLLTSALSATDSSRGTRKAIWSPSDPARAQILLRLESIYKAARKPATSSTPRRASLGPAYLISECAFPAFLFSELLFKQKTSCFYYSMMS